MRWGEKSCGGRSTGAHQNNTIRARIIALYDIFLIKLGATQMSGRDECQDVKMGTLVGIFAFPFDVMTSGRKGKESSRASRVSESRDLGTPITLPNR